MMDETGVEQQVQQLDELRQRHRELDEEIQALENFPFQDQLRIRRLKKEKLRLKETIQRLRAALIPDWDA